MDFKVIDEMGPFLLIENDDDNCGLIDAEGNLCIPCEMGCVMDHGGEDYYLFACEKDGKYGLLLPNGM